LLHRKVVATDIDPWSVRVARSNAALNGIVGLLDCRRV
jgi:ribosomal protein L11 methyltransferase